jgi:subtilisin family serine protease
MMKKISISLLSMAMITSCAPKSNSQNPLDIISSYIFSNRQQAATDYVGMIQLKLPALLKEAKIENGKAVIDEELKQAILDEQDEVISRLQAISPNIKIIARYRMVLNAIAFVAPAELAGKIETVEGVTKIIERQTFERPKTMTATEKVESLARDLNAHNTVKFIAADKLHKLGIDGTGMRVGVIDTGIDYTHKMFGGPGTVEAYKAVNPDEKSEFFPNQKVVGGVDFVGTNFNAASGDLAKQIPLRDENPLDEAEHGTHVGGTVAGIGDGVKSYSGVAPKADLYALKVFGKEGSTTDIAVIQALEYAADTTESLDPKNRLDVVNLSLGGGFGKPQIMYNEAIANLTRAGTIVVASAGNSGDTPYITGAPGTSDEAISIAASIDDLDQNIVSDAIEFKIADTKKVVELVEGTITVPAKDSKVSGELVYIGNGADSIPDDTAAMVNGRIALIDRGAINFSAKFEVARKLGAIGVVVANNQDSAPIPMGGDGRFEFPAVMITKALGNEIKETLKTKAVSIDFSSEAQIRHEEKIDQITDFSSRGPRSIDSLIKPEIAAPGANIISAHSGTGSESVMFSGTSMAAPHMAGVMALMRQAFPTLSVRELKAKIMNTSKIMMESGKYLPVSRQGAGRVQVDLAFLSKVIAMPAALSLGEIQVAGTKSVSKEVTFKNISDKDVIFTTKALKGKNVDVNVPASFRVKAKSEAKIRVSVIFKRNSVDESNIESDGFVIFTTQDGEQIHLPFLGIMNKVSDLKASELVTQTDSKEDKFGAEVKLLLKNSGKNAGEALLFNLLGTDEAKIARDLTNLSSNVSCDLEAAGIRVVDRVVEGKAMKILQVGVKLFDTLSIWQPCDISLQLDNNADGIADQELVGIKANYVSGINLNQIASLLLDANIAREIRKSYEADPNSEENYIPAVQDAQNMKFYDHGSVAIIETDLSKVVTGKDGSVGIKLSVTNLESNETSGDDFLASHGEKFQKIFLKEESLAFTELPELLTVNGNDQQSVSFKRGAGSQRLLALFPFNANLKSAAHDKEIQILSEKLLK